MKKFASCLIALFFLSINFVSAEMISLPKTGQVVSYAAGDDGASQLGITWSSPRFTSNGNGTVTDNFTGLMWLSDGDCAKTSGYDSDGSMIWSDALGFVASVNSGLNISACSSYSAAYTDWRLPNVNELKSLVHTGYYSETCAGVSCFSIADWLNNNGFHNIPLSQYWSSTTSVYGTPASAWSVNMWVGTVGRPYKTSVAGHAFLVRGATGGSGKVAVTGQSASYATGDDYENISIAGGAVLPSPRFSDLSDGTVIDLFTGLMWLKDANCFGTKTWSNALSVVADFNANSGGYACQEYAAPYMDWRLSNRNELQSLIDFSRANPALPYQHPFAKVALDKLYWTSSSRPLNPSTTALPIRMGSGEISAYGKSNLLYTWPVRDAFKMKLPLPANKHWVLSVEAGGNRQCNLSPDTYHTNSGYYALDFVDNNQEDGHLEGTDVPILAVANGIVTESSCESSSWGCTVVIDHGNNYSTRYAHIKTTPLVNQNSPPIVMGQQIGIMGNTGNSSGIHLHFQVYHNEDSSSTNTALKAVYLDGLKLDDYEVSTSTDCNAAVYLSTNQQ